MEKAEKEYDPAWLVRLAAEQLPERNNVIEALSRCTKKVGECSCGCGAPYFIDPSSSEWNFLETEALRREDGVMVWFDIMKNGRIGAVEIYDRDKMPSCGTIIKKLHATVLKSYSCMDGEYPDDIEIIDIADVTAALNN